MAHLQWKMQSSKILSGKDLYLVASDKGLQCISTQLQKHPMASLLSESEILANSVQQLNEYFEGQRKVFNLELDLQGTPFQQMVWEELLKIPFGETISYKKLAHRLKNENACRAVGTANGKNPVCIVVPCHRVIAANGGLGGYSGGLDLKKSLLQLENPQPLLSATSDQLPEVFKQNF